MELPCRSHSGRIPAPRTSRPRIGILAEKAVPHHHDPFGRRPGVLAVAHAAAAGAGMDRLGPLSRRRGKIRHGPNQLHEPRVARPQEHLCDVHGQIHVDPGVDHVLEEPAADQAAIQKVVRGAQQPSRRGGREVRADSPPPATRWPRSPDVGSRRRAWRTNAGGPWRVPGCDRWRPGNRGRRLRAVGLPASDRGSPAWPPRTSAPRPTRSRPSSNSRSDRGARR